MQQNEVTLHQGAGKEGESVSSSWRSTVEKSKVTFTGRMERSNTRQAEVTFYCAVQKTCQKKFLINSFGQGFLRNFEKCGPNHQQASNHKEWRYSLDKAHSGDPCSSSPSKCARRSAWQRAFSQTASSKLPSQHPVPSVLVGLLAWQHCEERARERESNRTTFPLKRFGIDLRLKNMQILTTGKSTRKYPLWYEGGRFGSNNGVPDGNNPTCMDRLNWLHDHLN